MGNRLEDLEPNGFVRVVLTNGIKLDVLPEELDGIRAATRLALHDNFPEWWSGTGRCGDAVDIRTDQVAAVVVFSRAGSAFHEVLNAAINADSEDEEDTRDGDEWRR
jgi:hypothetical protein